MAKLHKRLRIKKGGKRPTHYYTVRTRRGSEYGLGWNKAEAQEIVDHYSALERKERHGIPLPSKSDWTLETLKKHDLALARRDGQEIASRERRWHQILDYFGSKTLIDDITAARIGDFTRRRLQTVGVATVRRDRSVLANALARARDPESGSGYEGDPFRGLDSMARQERKARKKTPIFRPRLVDEVIAAAWELGARKPPAGVRPGEWRQNAEMLEVLYLTSSRVRQIRHLRRDQVREHPNQTGLIVLWFPPDKRGEQRIYDYEGRLQEILEGITDDGSPWFFPSQRADGPRDNLRRFLERAKARAMEKLARAKRPAPELAQLTLRSLRKSKASADLAAGVPIPAVQEQLGHRFVTTTAEWYAEVFPSTMKARRPPRIASPRPSPQKSGKAPPGAVSNKGRMPNSRGNAKIRARASSS
jgi:integrase